MDNAEDLITQMHLTTSSDNLPLSAEKQNKPYPQYLDTVTSESGLIKLPDSSDFIPQDTDLLKILVQRRSLRRYDNSVEMSLVELSYLIRYTQGIREFDEKRELTTRFVPSAGSRHPFETFLLIQRVDGLTPGIYRYVSQKHALEIFNLSEETIQKVYESVYKQKQVVTSAVTFFWVANVYRTSWRYSTRAYRYILIDAGHVCQNLYLCAESIDYGVCAIGHFEDPLANEMLGLDGVERFLVYGASVGKKIHQA